MSSTNSGNMTHRWSERGRQRHVLLLMIFSSLVFAGTGTVLAQEAALPVVRVEEDWSVEIGVPDPNEDSPQIINVISPDSGLVGRHAVFEINHRTMPDYAAGGMQLQAWNSEQLFEARNAPHSEKLTTSGERITYTLKLTATDGQMRYEVVGGTSTTWGTFGGEGYLKTMQNSDRTDLAGYDPAVSMKYSRIGFASHRVRKFALREVRFYSTEGLVRTDDSERVVHFHEAN